MADNYLQALSPGNGQSFDELYRQYMNEEKRKRERERGLGAGKYVAPVAIAAWGAGLGGMLQQGMRKDKFDFSPPVAGASVGAGVGLGVGLLAAALLNKRVKDQITTRQEDEAWRYAAMMSGRVNNPQRTLV